MLRSNSSLAFGRLSRMAALTLSLAAVAWAHEAHGHKLPERAGKLVNPIAGKPGDAKLYQRYCAGCHGPDGKTPAAGLRRRPPSLVDHNSDSMRDGEIWWVITYGSPPAMPQFARAIDEHDRWRIVNQVRELRARERARERVLFGDYEWKLPPGFPYPKVPADNRMSAAKVEAGRYLFYDRDLSANRTQSCATCHQQSRAFSDGMARGKGSTGELHPRGPMALINVAYSPALTWANPNMRSLEQQALVPMFGEVPVELGMNGKETELLARLRAKPPYPALFAAAFPGEADPFTIRNVTRAIATFERTLISGNSPYDRYRFGGDQRAISAAARRGEALFFSERLECFHCHGGFNFTGTVDYFDKGFAEVEFHNTGLYNVPGKTSYPPDNTGLAQFTEASEDVGKFKAPTLRNIAVTAPYMHDGSVATLDEAIEHYAAGGRTVSSGPWAGDGSRNPAKSEFVKPFRLSPREKADLLEFLGSLTDDTFLTAAEFADPWQQAGGKPTLHGFVKSIDYEAGTAFIQHDAVAGLMNGMTMEFRAVKPEELRQIARGDEIEAEVEERNGVYWISNIRKAGKPKPKKEIRKV